MQSLVIRFPGSEIVELCQLKGSKELHVILEARVRFWAGVGYRKNQERGAYYQNFHDPERAACMHAEH